MSLAPYSYRPATPPEVAAVGRLGHSSHKRSLSSTTCYSNDTSPDSVAGHLITPNRSPILRQHGPTLLPKIRTQDSLESSAGGPKRNHRRVLSTTRNPPAFAPYSTTRPQMQRSVTEPVECTHLISPISNSSFFGSRANSVALDSPTMLTVPPSRRPSASHSRGGSTSSIDESMLSRYGYPTYRQLPVYVSQAHNQTPSPTVYATTYAPYQPPIHVIEASPYLNNDDFDLSMDLTYDSRPSSLTPEPSLPPPTATNGSLLTYLTEPTQPINLVRHLTLPTGRGMQSHFWWDIRNLRPWSSFSLATMSTIPGLLDLLNLSIDTSTLPHPAQPSTTVTPASEPDLASLIAKIYFPKINAALAISQGSSALSIYTAPAPPSASNPAIAASAPTFLANYAHDNDRVLVSGLPRGRLVGLAKSFDRWNTGMRFASSPARKVDYLNGLAHLQKCMRDHSCRYGFIITEIELVCVRAGCDESWNPWFGVLEVGEAVELKTASSEKGGARGATPEPQETKLTVSLALYYLLMLAKATPLPGQAGGFMDVGGPGAMTRQRVLPTTALDSGVEERKADGRDKWIPEPQVGEKRDAKRVRGWVWPNDPWHKREGMGVGRRGGSRS